MDAELLLVLQPTHPILFIRYEYQLQFPLLLKSAVPTCIRLSAIYPDDRVIRAIWYTVIRLYYHSPNEFFTSSIL